MGLLNWWQMRQARRMWKASGGFDVQEFLQATIHEGGNFDERQKPILSTYKMFIDACKPESAWPQANQDQWQRLGYALFFCGASARLCASEQVNRAQAHLLMSNCLRLARVGNEVAEEIAQTYEDMLKDHAVKQVFGMGFDAMNRWKSNPAEPVHHDLARVFAQ